MPFLSGSQAEPLLREFETEVLDKFHNSLPLWARPGEAATFGLLAAYDSLFLPLMEMAPFLSSPDSVTRAKYIDEGLAQALRWLLARDGQLAAKPVDDKKIVSDARNFLEHATRYVCIADLHRSFGYGFVSASVDPTSRVVRFDGPRSAEAWMNASGQYEAFNKLVTSKPIRRLPKLLELGPRIRRRVRLLDHAIESSCVKIRNPIELNNEVFFQLSDAMHDVEPIELSEDADLTGFSVAEFDRFWFAILRWSAASIILYTQEPDPSVVFPTQIVGRSDFESQMIALTELPADVLQHIIARLSFGSAIQTPDYILQPLIATADSIAWSPRLVLACRHRRNMLKLMAKLPTLKASADNLIGAGERVLLQEIRSCLVKRGYQLKLNTPIQNERGEGEFDMLAWTNRAPEQVLVIEGKAVLPTDEIGEVADLTKKVLGGQQQLLRAIGILDEIPVERKHQLFKFVPWTDVKNVLGFVITSEGYPTSDYDYTVIPATDLLHFKSLRPRDLRTPERIVTVLRDRPWFRDLATLTRNEHESIHVGGVEYQIPLLVEEE